MTIRTLTDQEKRDIKVTLERMDSIVVTILPDGANGGARFMAQCGTSALPVNRVAGKLKRRGCTVENVGNSRVKVICFPPLKAKP